MASQIELSVHQDINELLNLRRPLKHDEMEKVIEFVESSIQLMEFKTLQQPLAVTEVVSLARNTDYGTIVTISLWNDRENAKTITATHRTKHNTGPADTTIVIQTLGAPAHLYARIDSMARISTVLWDIESNNQIKLLHATRGEPRHAL